MNHVKQLTELPINYKRSFFMNGEWREGQGGVFNAIDPATGEIVAELTAATVDDVNAAITAAHSAFISTEWQNMLPHERARILYQVARLIRENKVFLAALQTKDNGKPLYETLGLVESAAGTAQYYASVCETREDAIPTQRIPHVMTLSQYEALGVVGAISPWNSPIASEMQKLAPAIAAGNAVILKPAEATSLLAIEVAKIFAAAGLPKGILSVVVGKGSIVGDAIVRHPLVKKVTFTGGTTTGIHLAKIAAEKLMPISLELGGKSPTIVLADADVEQAVKGVIYGIFSSVGQACIAGSRLFVHQSLYNEFLEKMVAVTESLVIGAPTDPKTHVGPLISVQHRRTVQQFVEKAERAGATIIIGGHSLTGGAYDKGAYFEPTIMTGLAHSHESCQEEIFGPVLFVFPFKDESELLHLANDSRYGLAAGIWTRDTANALVLGKQIQAGTIWINTYKKFSISTPFGGYKDSGMGREKGLNGLLAYMQQKSFYINLNQDQIDWAEPKHTQPH